MKKLYFLNEEESKRILNLHKDATKRQYLNEQEISSVPTYGLSPSTGEKPAGYLESKFTPSSNTTNTTATTATTDTTPDKTKVQSKTNPLVTKIQQSLKEKGVNLGTSGPNKDGIDGILGKLTLNGIVSALGGGTTVEKTTKTEIKPDTMVKKEVSLSPEPNAELKLKQTTPSTPTPAADTKVATASTTVKDDEVAVDDNIPDADKY